MKKKSFFSLDIGWSVDWEADPLSKKVFYVLFKLAYLYFKILVVAVCLVFWPFTLMCGIAVLWDKAKEAEKKPFYQYLESKTEVQCFAIANDKSETKFEAWQRQEAYKRGCELRRIRVLGE